MYLTALATVARRTGYPVVEVDGWKTRGHGGLVSVETIVCHHTAGPKTGNMPSLNVIKNGRSGLPGPLAQLGLGRDGTIYVVAAGRAWHAGVVKSASYGNSYAIGIEAEATGVTSWPSVQVDAYAKLCRELCRHYGLPVGRVLGHKEVCSPTGRKIDPNFSMPNFRTRIANLGPTTTQPKWKTAKYVGLLRVRDPYMRGSKYGPSIRRVQDKVKAARDGVYGPQTAKLVRAWQRNHKLVADGIVGPVTWNAMF